MLDEAAIVNVTAAEDKPPATVNRGTSFTATPVAESAAAILFEPINEPDGKVAPVADIDIAPVPSPEIVAPARSIVFPDKYKSLHLHCGEPKS